MLPLPSKHMLKNFGRKIESLIPIIRPCVSVRAENLVPSLKSPRSSYAFFSALSPGASGGVAWRGVAWQLAPCSVQRCASKPRLRWSHTMLPRRELPEILGVTVFEFTLVFGNKPFESLSLLPRSYSHVHSCSPTQSLAPQREMLGS